MQDCSFRPFPCAERRGAVCKTHAQNGRQADVSLARLRTHCKPPPPPAICLVRSKQESDGECSYICITSLFCTPTPHTGWPLLLEGVGGGAGAAASGPAKGLLALRCVCRPRATFEVRTVLHSGKGNTAPDWVGQGWARRVRGFRLSSARCGIAGALPPTPLPQPLSQVAILGLPGGLGGERGPRCPLWPGSSIPILVCPGERVAQAASRVPVANHRALLLPCLPADPAARRG